MKYKFKYVDKVEPAGKPAGLALGSVVHSVIEWVQQQRIAGKEPALDDILRIFEADWAAVTVDTVLLKDDQIEGDLVAQGRGLLQTYLEHPSPNPVVAVEIPFRFYPVYPLTGETLDVPLEGRIDQVEQAPGQSPVLVELKTAARRYSETEIARQFQLTAYDWAFEEQYEEVALLRLDVLLKTKKPQLLRHTATRGKEDRIRFFDLAADVLDGIRKEVFPANPGWGCAGCEYGHKCPWGAKEAVAYPR